MQDQEHFAMEVPQQDERNFSSALNVPSHDSAMPGNDIAGDYRSCGAGDVQRADTPNAMDSNGRGSETISCGVAGGRADVEGAFPGQVSGGQSDAGPDNYGSTGQQQQQQSFKHPSDIDQADNDGRNAEGSAAPPYVFHYITNKREVPGAERSSGYYHPSSDNSPRTSGAVAEENCCCVECGVTFANIDLLLKHVQVHEAEQYGSDDIYQAGASPEDEGSSDGVVSGENGGLDNAADISQDASDISSDYGGAVVKNEQADATCMECGQVFDEVDALLRHVEIMHEVIVAPQQLRQTTTKHDTGNIHHQFESAFSCPVCQQGFADERPMLDHLKRHNSRGGMPSLSSSHRPPGAPGHPPEGGLGPKADFNVFTYRKRAKKDQAVNGHSVGNGPKTAHLCLICGDVFRQLANLDTHYQGHMRSSPTAALDHKCSICGKVFSKAHNLSTHMRLHNQERPYACALCGKRFTQSSHLRQHELIHTQVRPFSCRFCPKMFRQSSHLHMHERIHTGMRPYKCALCDKAFMQSSHLRIHERTHSRVRPYTCRFCNATFIQSAHMRLHEKRHLNEAGAGAAVGANGVQVVTSQHQSPPGIQNGMPMDAEPIQSQVTA